MDSIGGTRYSCIVPPATAAEFWSVTSPVMEPLPAMEHPQCGVQNDPYPPTAFHSCYAGKTRVFARGISGLIKTSNLYLIFKNFDSLLLFFFFFFLTFSFQSYLPSFITYHITWHHINLLVSLSAVAQGFLFFPVWSAMPLWGHSPPMFLHMEVISFVAHNNHRILSSPFSGYIHALRYSGPLVQGFI